MKTPVKQLTQERLKYFLHYNPLTGIFTNKLSRSRSIKKNEQSGALTNGYISIMIDYKAYRAHRLAFLYMEGYFPETEVDHINREKDDNRWCNLREVSRTCNNRNRTIGKNNTSGVVGVSWNVIDDNWTAYIGVESGLRVIGTYLFFQQAVFARWEAEKKYNYPNCNTTSTAHEYLKKNNILCYLDSI